MLGLPKLPKTGCIIEAAATLLGWGGHPRPISRTGRSRPARCWPWRWRQPAPTPTRAPPQPLHPAAQRVSAPVCLCGCRSHFGSNNRFSSNCLLVLPTGGAAMACCGAPEPDLKRQTETQNLVAGLQGYLAGIGSVPWLAGGEDWNFDPEQMGEWRARRWAAQQAGTTGPTQRHGRNLDWNLGGRRKPVQAVGTEVVPETVHVRVAVTIGAAARGMLERGMVTPTPIPPGLGSCYTRAMGQHHRQSLRRPAREPRG